MQNHNPPTTGDPADRTNAVPGDDGFLALRRGFIPYFLQLKGSSAERLGMFVYLLKEAWWRAELAHLPPKLGGVTVELERGQLVKSQRKLAEELKVKRPKLQRFMNWLERRGEISREPVGDHRTPNRITIINYDEHIASNRPQNRNRTRSTTDPPSPIHPPTVRESPEADPPPGSGTDPQENKREQTLFDSVDGSSHCSSPSTTSNDGGERVEDEGEASEPADPFAEPPKTCPDCERVWQEGELARAIQSGDGVPYCCQEVLYLGAPSQEELAA